MRNPPPLCSVCGTGLMPYEARTHRTIAGLSRLARLVTKSLGPTTGVAFFRGDDDGYLRWLAGHTHGYVLNAQRSPRAAYLKLHRAFCPHISGQPRIPGAWTERQYIKVCAEDIDALERWAQDSTGGRPGRFCSCVS